jgi:hypothetical protein
MAQQSDHTDLLPSHKGICPACEITAAATTNPDISTTTHNKRLFKGQPVKTTRHRQHGTCISTSTCIMMSRFDLGIQRPLKPGWPTEVAGYACMSFFSLILQV